MPLIDLKTDLKSLRYGKDTPGGGYSGQPYIQTPIPDGLLPKSPDFFLRNGYLAFQSTRQDVSRLQKMFTDTKSFNGLGFITKQNVLANSAVRTQASGVVNGGAYRAYSTLLQAGEVTFGGHLNKQGTNPFRETGAYANNDRLYGVAVKPSQPSSENRLVNLQSAIDENIAKRNFDRTGIGLNIGPGVNVLRYRGGPDADRGVGLTNIRFASIEQRTGKQNKYYVDNKDWFEGKNQRKATIDFNKIITIKGVSKLYDTLTGITVNNLINELGQRVGNQNFNVYDPNTTPGNTWPKNSELIFANNTFTFDQKTINEEFLNEGKLQGAPSYFDFRKTLRTALKTSGTTAQQETAKKTGATPNTPSYIDKNYENRTNIGGYNNLGAGNAQGKNLNSYTKGSGIGPIDKINALPVYLSENVNPDLPINDLVKFRIAVINNQNPRKKTFIHFRAFINSFQDTYNSSWTAQNYLGRAEKFYNYQDFNRQINLSFTVAAQSKEELIEQHRKLNFLASTLAPDYGYNGYMKGNLIQLTVGGYLFEQPGFISSLNFEIPADSPWEIGLNDEGNSDANVKELPHMINVGGFQFTPIHNFAPAIQDIVFTGEGVNQEVALYGKQRYIALTNGASNNWNTSYENRELVQIQEEDPFDTQLNQLNNLESLNLTPTNFNLP